MGMNQQIDKHSYWKEVRETLRLVASLPDQFFLVLLLEFLNSFRTAALRMVLFNYVTNEFNFSDDYTGAVLGLKGLLDVFFGLMGSILVDLIGVRMTSLIALSMSFVGRSLVCFSRSSLYLYVALFFFSPCGEALLGTGLYRVALKKLSTPRIRPFVFGIAYAVNNLACLVADVTITVMRTGSDSVFFGMVFTPTRKFMIISLLSILISLLIAVVWLKDMTIASVLDPEEGITIPNEAKDTDIFLRCCFSQNQSSGYKGYETENGMGQLKTTREPSTSASTLTSASHPSMAILSDSLWWVLQQVKELLMMSDTWRLLIFGFLVVPVGMQWAATEFILIPFIERHFGENAPMYMIQSINFAGCLIFPPIVSALTTHLDDFRMILPGLWIMAVAPLILVMMPTVHGACLWQMLLTIGDVFWSPRVLSWTARLAPTGKEGLFFALATTRAILAPLTDFFLGNLNALYNPNCQDCRDAYGHFCSTPRVFRDNTTIQQSVVCVSPEDSCKKLIYVANSTIVSCPSTCVECPGWQSNATKLWSIILFVSLSSPFIIWILLPFFQGVKTMNDRFYGLFECGIHRVLNITGYAPNVPQAYQRVRKDSSMTAEAVMEFANRKNVLEIDDDEYEYD